MDVQRRLSVNVQRLRREKGWSQEDLAFEADIHRTYISGIERCLRNPTITVVDRLANGLGVTCGDLLNEPPKVSRRGRKKKAS